MYNNLSKNSLYAALMVYYCIYRFTGHEAKYFELFVAIISYNWITFITIDIIMTLDLGESWHTTSHHPF